MLIKEKARQLLEELVIKEQAQLELGGFFVSIRLVHDASTLLLTTTVYEGGNYIPNSVRLSLSEKPPFLSHGTLSYRLKIDEENYRIILSHVDPLREISESEFVNLLEDFGWLATEWQEYLEHRDRNDLVPIWVKRG